MSVDLCFVMDCTGSMEQFISACKRDINVTISKVLAEYPGTVVRLGFVGYRDHWDDNRIEIFDFSTDVQQFQYFVGCLEATGGNDWAEDVLGGLWEGATMPWTSTTRVLFHIFDAPPHGIPKFHDEADLDELPNGHPNDRTTSQIFLKMKENFVDYYMVPLGIRLEKTVQVFLQDAGAVSYEHIQQRAGVSEVSRIMEDVGNAVLNSLSVTPSLKRRGRNRVDPIHRPRGIAKTFKAFCGIDFGTHGSAYAFCSPGDRTVHAENDWGGSNIGVKTLTHLLLGPDKKCLDGPAGFGTAAGEMYLEMTPEDQRAHYFFRRFKMELYESPNHEEEDEKKSEVEIHDKIIAANGKRVLSETVLSEALTFMINHAMEKIVQHNSLITNLADVQWILTVPAIWSQKSRRVMEKAAYSAGIPRGQENLIIALEPECAAVDIQDCLNLGEGECYMMVDCGGGTVDIACHELINDGTEVAEIYKADGGPWGSTFIDREFERLLELIFERAMDAIEEEQEEEPGLQTRILANFNLAKRMAQPTDDVRNVSLEMIKPILLDVYGSIEAINEHLSSVEYEGISGGIEFRERRGMLCLSRQIWERLFGIVIEPLVERIHHLLTRPDLSEKIQTICVVGGFANSPILMKRLQDEFGESRRVFRPPNPILAVVKGAAKFGMLPTMIASRTAPKTIGIAIRDEWKEEDGVERREWVRGVGYTVEGVFFPFVRAGDSIPRDMPPIVRYVESVGFERFQIEIYQTDDPNPRFVPERPCGVIGPVDFPPPPEFDHNQDDICVQMNVSDRVISVEVQFGRQVIPAEIRWE